MSGYKEMPIVLPTDVTTAEYDGLDGESRTATGTAEEITRALERAGYRVVLGGEP